MNGRASSSWEANRKIWKLLPAVFMIDNHVGVPVHCNICIYGLATGKTILYKKDSVVQNFHHLAILKVNS